MIRFTLKKVGSYLIELRDNFSICSMIALKFDRKIQT